MQGTSTNGADLSRLAGIRLLICDVDGVLTDGTLSYTANGEEIKHFNVKDGLGIRLLMHHGIEVAIISARNSEPLHRRINDLGIRHFYPGQDDKLGAFNELLARLNLKPEEVACIGDDILDLPVMRQVGLSVTVADGHDLVQTEAKVITSRKGGQGAVRELADVLMGARMPLAEAYEHLLATREQTHLLRTA